MSDIIELDYDDILDEEEDSQNSKLDDVVKKFIDQKYQEELLDQKEDSQYSKLDDVVKKYVEKKYQERINAKKRINNDFEILVN